ncbi:hypothetical protein G7K_5511-t1 [Saitoella complicata NRRL Y-17804]|uniref:Uncharacterized protein n=1 Tax=Saitoella complicata (strain BCRC 22490 / CBS 7301 / JCM 7358 / NBRC 10748 / NRRL Y-17804) TaxID=698492 RepID=A0A0E9NNK8_SAICN|nr:hypothetical protein G7K_5511-t1 [Saitoella complicata NRRL Y-17804]
MASTNLKTTHVFTLRATLELGQTVGQTLSGIRIFVPVSGGTLKGPDIEAEILPVGGGDWLSLNPDQGHARLDVRLIARTSQNELLYAYYPGHLPFTPNIGAIAGGDKEAKSTGFDDTGLLTQITIETGSERLAWMNKGTFVGKGRFLVGEGSGVATVEYDVFKIE